MIIIIPHLPITFQLTDNMEVNLSFAAFPTALPKRTGLALTTPSTILKSRLLV